jgi:hypothetical protein
VRIGAEDEWPEKRESADDGEERHRDDGDGVLAKPTPGTGRGRVHLGFRI